MDYLGNYFFLKINLTTNSKKNKTRIKLNAAIFIELLLSFSKNFLLSFFV